MGPNVWRADAQMSPDFSCCCLLADLVDCCPLQDRRRCPTSALIYGDATSCYSSRQIELATDDSVAFRFSISAAKPQSAVSPAGLGRLSKRMVRRRLAVIAVS